MFLIGKVIIKGTDRGDFPRSGCGSQAIIGIGAVVVLGAVAAEVGHIAVNIRQRHIRNKSKIHVHDINFVQRSTGKRWISQRFQITEKIPQIQVIFVDSPPGMGFDRFMVRKKFPQNRRRIRLIIDHGKNSPQK